MKELTAKVSSLNPFARIIPTDYCNVDITELIGKNTFDLGRYLHFFFFQMVLIILYLDNVEKGFKSIQPPTQHGHSHGHSHGQKEEDGIYKNLTLIPNSNIQKSLPSL